MRKWLLLLLWPQLLWAHGGLPVSQSVLRDGDTMFIPVVFWGLWVGPDNGPWLWICEEVINQHRTRKYTLSADGTFYTTDVRGLTISNDEGCTWVPATGEIAGLRTSDVVADLSDGATAWATTDTVMSDADGGTTADNALFVTHDHGATFNRVPSLSGIGRRFHNLKLGSGGVIYVSSAGLSTPFDVTLHKSSDGGGSFEARPVDFQIDGIRPYSGEVMAIDPRNSDVVYLRVFLTLPPGSSDGGPSMPLQILLRSADGGVTVTELLRVVGEMTPSGATRGIDGVAVDGARGKLYVATSKGLLAGDDAGGAATVNLQPTGGLSQAQCVEVHGSAVYVCGSNYGPDFKALARSDDGAQTFHQVLSYQSTVGPISCPRGTPVGDDCPLYWTMYSSQLGIETGIDGGGDAGGEGGGDCACSVGGRHPMPWLSLLMLLLLVRRRERA